MQPDVVAGDAEAEAKRQRKAAKRAAKEAAAAAAAEATVEDEVPVTEKNSKKAKKAAELAEVVPVDEAEAKRQRKAARKAAKEAAAGVAEEVIAQTPKKAEKKKRAAEAEIAVEAEEVPKAKKSKPLEAIVEDTKEGMVDKNALKVFIKGLPYSADEATVRKEFAECGDITEFKMPINDQGMPKGYAFIQFATQAGFDNALKFDNTDYGGRYLNVSKVADRDAACKGKAREGDWTCPSCSEMVFASKSNCRKCGSAKPGTHGGDNVNTVFIRGLPWTVTEVALRQEFSACGEIERLSLPKTEEGKPKGISFITYKSQEGVNAALKFDNTEYGGRTIFVSVAGEAPKCKGGKDKGKGKGKDGKSKDGKGNSKGKSKFVPTAAFATKTGCIVEGAGEKKTFADSDED